MGITIRSNNRSLDMGYGGFDSFRQKIATLASEEFGVHYANVKKGVFMMDETARSTFFNAYDKKTKNLIEKGVVTAEIANFCYQSDCEGFIDQQQAQQITEKMKCHTGKNFAYGYVGRPDCATFERLLELFQDCVTNGGKVEWD